MKKDLLLHHISTLLYVLPRFGVQQQKDSANKEEWVDVKW